MIKSLLKTYRVRRRLLYNEPQLPERQIEYYRPINQGIWKLDTQIPTTSERTKTLVVRAITD